MKIAIIGSTGNVGRKVVERIIQDKLLKPSQLDLFASSKSDGQIINIHGENFKILSAEKADFRNYKFCIFVSSSEVARNFVPLAKKAGCIIIDSSSEYRLEANTPLIVGPVNGHLIGQEKHQLYSVANCLTSPICVALHHLHLKYRIKRIVITTFQSVSGYGKAAMEELKKQISGEDLSINALPRQIAYNVIPQVDKILENGETYEEYKIINEVKKILGNSIEISATAVRVPVFVGHSISLNVEFLENISYGEILEILKSTPMVKISKDHYSTPIEAIETDDVYVGRIRIDNSQKNTINLWTCSDNLRRGASTDIIEVLNKLLDKSNFI